VLFDRNDQGLRNLEDLRHYSGMKGDPLTDILSLTSARCAEVGILVAGGSWALRFPPPQKIKLVAVIKGNCWLTFKDELTPLQVKTGDVVVLPAERAFVLAGDLNAPQADASNYSLARPARSARSGVVMSSSRSERTSLWIPSVADCSRRCCHPYFT